MWKGAEVHHVPTRGRTLLLALCSPHRHGNSLERHVSKNWERGCCGRDGELGAAICVRWLKCYTIDMLCVMVGIHCGHASIDFTVFTTRFSEARWSIKLTPQDCKNAQGERAFRRRACVLLAVSPSCYESKMGSAFKSPLWWLITAFVSMFVVQFLCCSGLISDCFDVVLLW